MAKPNYDNHRTASFITPEFRASYMFAFEPGEENDNGKRFHEVTMLFAPGADLSSLKKAVIEVMTSKFGPDQAKWPKNIHTPFKKQDDKIASGTADGKDVSMYAAGGIMARAASTKKPGIVDNGQNPAGRPQPILDPSKFWSGCYAKAQIHAYWWDKGLKKGVSFGLDNLQMTREGERLGKSGPSAESAFEPIADSEVGGGTDSSSIFA